jgi:amino acid transporter
MSLAEVEAASDFAVSAAAGTFLGPAGFAIMSIGAVLASASAINADFFGAAKLPPRLAADRELPSAFQRQVRSQSPVSLAAIGLLALAAVNFVAIHELSSATSAGFLLVFAAVNLAAVRLRRKTGTNPVLPAAALALCLFALAVMLAEFLSSPATITSAIAVGAIVALSLLVELGFRLFDRRPAST